MHSRDRVNCCTSLKTRYQMKLLLLQTSLDARRDSTDKNLMQLHCNSAWAYFVQYAIA